MAFLGRRTTGRRHISELAEQVSAALFCPEVDVVQHRPKQHRTLLVAASTGYCTQGRDVNVSFLCYRFRTRVPTSTYMSSISLVFFAIDSTALRMVSGIFVYRVPDTRYCVPALIFAPSSHGHPPFVDFRFGRGALRSSETRSRGWRSPRASHSQPASPSTSA